MSIYKRTSGRWAASVDFDRSSSKARERRNLGTFATKKEAQKAEREALTARDHGVTLARGAITVAELLERFLTYRESRGRGEKTLEEYRRTARLYIVPHIGGIAVAKLRPAIVSEWIAMLGKSGWVKNRPLAEKTVHHAFARLSSALRWGVRLELVGRNVCESVEAPQLSRSEAVALSDEENAALCAAAEGKRWQHFVTLALASGARRGELLALTWKHVDLDSSTPNMTIAGSLSQPTGSVFVKSTKTKRVRWVPLSEDMVAAFRAQRAVQAADCLRLGGAYVTDLTMPTASVFTNELGERQTPKSATNAIARLAKAAGISTTALHALRHTAATCLNVSGVRPEVGAKILGHANVTTFLNIYSHPIDGDERRAINALSGRLAEAKATALR